MGRCFVPSVAVLFAIASPTVLDAQAKSAATESVATRSAGFFDRVAPVRFTLTADIRLLLSDTADEAPSRQASVAFKDSAGNTVTLPVKVKTHGRWRLTHCEFPPLTITFPADKTEGTPFAGLPKARLTSYCKDHPAYEQY